MTTAQLINQTSGDVEYYTPLPIIEAARSAMGGIDLDPASSFTANLRVKAENYYTKEIDGLTMDWPGRVWCNHPFGRNTNSPWILKMVEEYESGKAHQICCLTFNSSSEKWFRPLLKRPQCVFYGRTNYILPSGEVKRGVTKGSVVTYFGTNIARFADSFRHLGEIRVSV